MARGSTKAKMDKSSRVSGKEERERGRADFRKMEK